MWIDDDELWVEGRVRIGVDELLVKVAWLEEAETEERCVGVLKDEEERGKDGCVEVEFP